MPAKPEQDKAEVGEVPSVTVPGAMEQARPVDGETEADKATTPVNPLMEET